MDKIQRILHLKVLELLQSQKLVMFIKSLIWNVLLTWTQIPKMKHFCSIEAQKMKAKVGI